MAANREPQDKWDLTNKWNRVARQDAADPRHANALDRLINQANVGEGPSLPPPVVRGIRVQPPSGFSIASQKEIKYATRFILRWMPNPSMFALGAKYRIYVYAQQNVTPMSTAQSEVNTPGWAGPLLAEVMADTSPAEVVVPCSRRQPVIFAIETRLPMGAVSLEESRPTCAGICNPRYSNVVTVTAAYTAGIDDETIQADTTSGSFAVTLYDCTQLPVGFVYRLVKLVAANTVTWTPFLAAQTINGAATLASTTQYESFNLRTDGTVWYKI